MNNTSKQQVTLFGLICESIGLPERGLMRLALSALAFGVTFRAIRFLVG